jgi:hypothetical protein
MMQLVWQGEAVEAPGASTGRAGRYLVTGAGAAFGFATAA